MEMTQVDERKMSLADCKISGLSIDRDRKLSEIRMLEADIESIDYEMKIWKEIREQALNPNLVFDFEVEKRPMPASACPRCGGQIIGVRDEDSTITCRGCGHYKFKVKEGSKDG